MEKMIEKLLFASRWILAPVYLGMSLALVALDIKFVMELFSGYENFVSALDVDQGSERLSWLGKLDANSLKLKVASSIVAISSIHLLSAFMKTPAYFTGENVENGGQV